MQFSIVLLYIGVISQQNFRPRNVILSIATCIQKYSKSVFDMPYLLETLKRVSKINFLFASSSGLIEYTLACFQKYCLITLISQPEEGR